MRWGRRQAGVCESNNRRIIPRGRAQDVSKHVWPAMKKPAAVSRAGSVSDSVSDSVSALALARARSDRDQAAFTSLAVSTYSSIWLKFRYL